NAFATNRIYILSLHDALPIWKLPVVFICENNGYAMGTSVERTANHTDIWKLGKGYEMPCGPVDGMNPVKVAKAVHKAFHSLFQRSEEHTSELQSRENLVCRLL